MEGLKRLNDMEAREISKANQLQNYITEHNQEIEAITGWLKGGGKNLAGLEKCRVAAKDSGDIDFGSRSLSSVLSKLLEEKWTVEKGLKNNSKIYKLKVFNA